MAKQTALELKRREAREEILTWKNKLPSARILNFFGRAFKNQSWGYWLSNIFLLNLILLSPWIIIGLALKENEKTILIWIPCIIAVEDAILGLIISHIVIQKIWDDTANIVVEKINNGDDLPTFIKWLKGSWSFQNVAPFVLLFCALWVFLALVSLSVAIDEFIGFGLSLTVVLVASLAGIAFYGPIWVSLLASNMKNYQYDINTFSPADSEIINNITDILTKRMSIVAAYFAVITLISTSNLIDPQVRLTFSLPIFLIGWILITAQFLLTHSTIGRIVSRAKWKTLNKIQAKINTIEATGDLSDKETAERLLRLADIHKQIIASKTNIFDLKSLSTFVSQLMLPLLGLLLGNLDKVIALLR